MQGLTPLAIGTNAPSSPQSRPNLAVERVQSRGEEIANSVSHGVALLAAVAGVPFLFVHARPPEIASIIGVAVFATTMVLLYLCSTLYHAAPAGRAKRILLRFDLGAIYFFIAGSYTPFALGAVGGKSGWVMFGLVWLLAFTGAGLKAFDRLSHPWLSTGLYLAMGWLVLFAAVPLIEHMPHAGLMLLVAGGLAYSAGVVFFMLDARVRYSHAVWHCFVAGGTGCHFFAVLGYAS